MTRPIRILLVISCVVALACSSFSQVLIDVKTRYTEKKELHFIKLALMTSLDTSGWARTTEIGEHFSLWLKNYSNHASGDSLWSGCDLEFHPPAMIVGGECLRFKHLEVAFDTIGLAGRIALSDSVVGSLMAQNLLDTDLLTRFLKLLGVSPSQVANHPVVNYLARKFVSNFMQVFNRRPNALEIIEASLLSAQALFEVRSFVEEKYPQALRR
ncbi:MAG: hypothetical protein WB699_02535 [Bacteroidota bacterium]